MKSTFRVAAIAFQIDSFGLTMPPFQSLNLFKQGTLTFQNLLDEKEFLFCSQVRILFLLVSGGRPNCTSITAMFVVVFLPLYSSKDIIYLLRHHFWWIHFILCILYISGNHLYPWKKMGLNIYSVELRTLLSSKSNITKSYFFNISWRRGFCKREHTLPRPSLYEIQSFSPGTCNLQHLE